MAIRTEFFPEYGQNRFRFYIKISASTTFVLFLLNSIGIDFCEEILKVCAILENVQYFRNLFFSFWFLVSMNKYEKFHSAQFDK